MAVKTVLRMGHPVLKKIAESVTEFNTPALGGLAEDIFDAMAAASNGAGLAALLDGGQQTGGDFFGQGRLSLSGCRRGKYLPGL